MHELGFEIGGHGHDRTELTALGDDLLLADIAAAGRTIEAVTGEPRAPCSPLAVPTPTNGCAA